MEINSATMPISRHCTEPILKLQGSESSINIGGNNLPVIQSMTNTPTRDVKATLDQINRLALAQCEVIRVAVPTEEDANALVEIARQSPIPVVADIHFKPEFALQAIKAGIAKIRINPGTCLQASKIMSELLVALKDTQLPVRIGVNSGSIAAQYRKEYSKNPVQALVQSALEYQRLLEDNGIINICLSIKSSDVAETINVYRQLANLTKVPLHVGITEAGPGVIGVTRNTIALWTLLSEGIGDTFRVSMTGDPVEEIKVAREIINQLSEKPIFPKIVSCPTCGRLAYNMEQVCRLVEDFVFTHRLPPLTIAVMGCEVNGPGECKHADLGITGNHHGQLFVYRKGELIKSNLSECEMILTLEQELLALGCD